MSDLKEYQKHKANRESLAGRITGLQNDIDRLAKELEPLEEDALKAEILELKDFEEKKRALKVHRQKIIDLKAELEESRKKLRVMNELLPGFQDKARMELAVKHRDTFKKALPPFIKLLQNALEAEAGLREIQKKAAVEFNENELGACPISDWIPFLQRTHEHPLSARLWEEQIKTWKSQFRLD